MRQILAIFSAIFISAIPTEANAQIRVWGPAAGLTAAGAINNIIIMLMQSGWAFCGAIFLTGALFLVFGGANERAKGIGKGMMIGAVIGAIVISGAGAIMNTVMYFVS